MKRIRLMATLALLLAGELVAANAPNMGMTTPWGEKVTSENAWRGYPRPQMVRADWTCLNGDWDYAVTKIKETTGRPKAWAGKIRVPFAIESSLSGVGRLLEPDEFLWYTRTIDVKKAADRRILLNFESVDFRAQVFIGHREVDVPHESLNVPFTCDITDYVVDGPNELTVCVWDPTDSGPIGATGKQYLSPRACFYTRCSGIIGSVWMESVPTSYVVGYKVTPSVARGCAVFTVSASNAREPKCRVRVLEGGACVAAAEGYVGEPLEVKMPAGFKLWSPDAPNLYDVEITLGADCVKGYFGMRSVERRRDAKGTWRYFFNGRPTFIAATLDQGWWPDGLLTPPSDEAMAYDIQTLKNCGFNAMRKHIKVEPRRYYHLCDRLGLMVLQDMPSDPPPKDGTASPDDGLATDTWRYGFYRRDLKRIMDHLHNAPCIVEWIPYNEAWSQPGAFLTHTTLDWVKAYDPSRIVGGPSGWDDFEGGILSGTKTGWKAVQTAHRPAGECEAGDTIDRHDYGKVPRTFPVNDRRISFLGEFGGVNYKEKGHLWDARGHFGYEQRESREALQEAYVALIDGLVPKAAEGLGGFVYTQTTDVEIETNGLLTYDRRVLKFAPAVLRAAHARIIAAAEAGK